MSSINQQLREGHDVKGTLEERRAVDPDTLNDGQREVFDLIQSHSETCGNEPLRLIVTGTAGTGKSYLIDAIKTYLGDKCAVTATTGVASFNVKGQTIHSLVKLCAKKVSGSTLSELQMKHEGVEYIILDEMSMMGASGLARLNARLKEIRPSSDEEFGGISVVMVGDLGQLPPVKDTLMWKKKNTERTRLMGSMRIAFFQSALT